MHEMVIKLKIEISGSDTKQKCTQFVLIIMLLLLLQAKLRSSLAWILQKAYGETVPSEFKDPFYEKTDVSRIIHVEIN